MPLCVVLQPKRFGTGEQSEIIMKRYAIVAAALLISSGMAAAQSTNPPQQYDSSGAPARPEPGKPNAAAPVPPDEMGTTGQAPRRDDRLQSDRNRQNEPAPLPGEEPKQIPR
jgi:hypothetical protein